MLVENFLKQIKEIKMKVTNTYQVEDKHETGRHVYIKKNVKEVACGKQKYKLGKRLIFGHINFYDGSDFHVLLILDNPDGKNTIKPYKLDEVMTEEEAKTFLQKAFEDNLKEIFKGES